MLFYHAFDKEVVNQACQRICDQAGSVDETMFNLRKELLGPLGAGSMACRKENVPQLLTLLAIRKLANADVDDITEKLPLAVVFEDDQVVPEKFGDLGILFSLFEVTPEDVEDAAAELGLIPAKIDLTSAFGIEIQEANTASWF